MINATRSLIALSVAMLTLTACGGDDPAASATDMNLQAAPEAVQAEPAQEDSSMEKTKTVTGTIVYKQLEGGFYALIGEDDARYTLQGLDKKYHQNGLVVKVTGTPMPDVMSITMFGTVFKVDSVEVISDAMVKPENPTH